MFHVRAKTGVARRQLAARSASFPVIVAIMAACSGDSSDPGGNGAAVATVEVAGTATIEVGATSQLTAIAKDGSGNIVTGKTFAWTSANQAVASVTAAGGLVTGQTTGSASIFASVDGKSGSLQVSVTTPTVPTISAISPSPLVPGQPATISGTNFSATPGSNGVTVGGTAASVTAASATSLTVTVPSALCVAGSAAVIVTVNGRASNTIDQPAPAVGTSVTTAIGQQTLVSNPGDFCLQFAATGATEAYLVGVQSVTEEAGSLTAVTFGASTASPAPSLGAMLPAAPAGPGNVSPLQLDPASIERWRRHRAAEAELRQVERRLDPGEVARFIESRSRTPGAIGPAAIPSNVAVGDNVPIRVPDRDDLCGNFFPVTTVVKAVGTRSVWLEDTANPTNGFTPADYTQMMGDFDDRIYGLDTEYFGSPSDLDNNSRIVIVVTKEVNKMDILGFTTNADLRPRSATCQSSDEGEIFYDRAPDPTGTFGDTYTREAALMDAPVLLAHEFTHIIQFSIRPTVLGNQGTATTWELEGQATFAEEINGHLFTGRATGQNLGFNVAFNCANPPGCDALTDPNDWFLPTFIDLVLYYGFPANCASGDQACLNTRIPGAPHQCTWTGLSTQGNTGPCFPGREVYGVPALFMRYLADNYGSSFAGGEKEMHQKLVANRFRGFETIVDVIGQPIDVLLAGWAAALYVDDRVSSPNPMLTYASWNLMEIADRLRTTAQLVPSERGFSNFTDQVQVRGGSTAYFRVSSTGRAATAVRVRGNAGALLPGYMRLWVVRLQ